MTRIRSRLAFFAPFLVALLFSPGCAGTRSRSPDSAGSGSLDVASFDLATRADLAIAGDELADGLLTATLDLPVDTHDAPARLSPAAFAEATRADAELEGEEGVAVAVAEAPAALAAPAKLTQITLNKDFIEQIKNRVTLTTQFQVVGTSKVHKVGAGGDDGDIHIGGIAEDVGLPCVVEVVNAKSHQDAVDNAKELADEQEVTQVTGPWRLWCEHSGVPQIQFDTPYHGAPSNPDHVLEIHPTSKFGDISLLASFVPIPGYKAYDAKKAFDYYESVSGEISVDDADGTVTILTPMARYNYAEFEIEIEDDAPFIVPDGRIVRCSVLDESHNVVASHRRMVFTKSTPPEKAVRKLKRGDRMRVLGIPRINLAVVAWRAKVAAERPEVLTWNLPYEMIIVAKL